MYFGLFIINNNYIRSDILHKKLFLHEYEFMNNLSIIHNNIVSNLPRLNRQTCPYLISGSQHYTSTLKK